MAKTLTVGEVLEADGALGMVGSGKVPHVLRPGKALTRCADAKVAKEIRAVAHVDGVKGLTLETKICARCASSVFAGTPEEKGDGVATKKNTDKPSEAEISALIQGMIDTIAEAKTDTAASDIQAKIESELLGLPSGKRAGLRMQMKEAMSKARESFKGKAASKEIETKETLDWKKEIPEGKHLFDEGTQQAQDVVAGFASAGASARAFAGTQVSMATLSKNKDGRPDLSFRSQAYRDWANEVYEAAGIARKEGQSDEERKRAVAAQSTIKRARSQSRVDYIRALDNSPEEAKLYGFVELAEGEKISEAVFRTYKINPLSEGELATQKAQLKAQQKRAELEAKKVVDAAGESVESATDSSKREAPQKRVSDVFGALLSAANKLDPAYLDGLEGDDLTMAVTNAEGLRDWAEAVIKRLSGDNDE
ncbi:hypothetical protein ACIQU6_07505 [Streptomyces sp. NPDC090442]|uniref:hypothetical protein n=1 Tax=Streptomyces sp. NPDC090442 TaxID=3365962 RepID=UPI0037F79B16